MCLVSYHKTDESSDCKKLLKNFEEDRQEVRQAMIQRTATQMGTQTVAVKRKPANTAEHRKIQRTDPTTYPMFISYGTTPTNRVFVSHDLIITHSARSDNAQGDVCDQVQYYENSSM